MEKNENASKEALPVRVWASAIALMILLISIVSPELYTSRPKNRRLMCAGNLKQIALALHQYAMDYGGRFPPLDGAKGLDLLRRLDYLRNVNRYVCPDEYERNRSKGCSCSHYKISQPLKDVEISYVFVGGLSRNDNPDSPICWDKPGNHSNWGNVLFVDGHVKGYAGADWLEKATGKGNLD